MYFVLVDRFQRNMKVMFWKTRHPFNICNPNSTLKLEPDAVSRQINKNSTGVIQDSPKLCSNNLTETPYMWLQEQMQNVFFFWMLERYQIRNSIVPSHDYRAAYFTYSMRPTPILTIKLNNQIENESFTEFSTNILSSAYWVNYLL